MSESEAPIHRDRRREQGAASRERLLEAAVALVAERGVAGTGVDAVCRRAGVVKSALYWHFRNKEGLVAAVVSRVGEAWVEEIRASVYRTGDPYERLDRFVAGVRALLEERPELLRLLLTVTLEGGETGPESRRAVRRVFERSRAAIAEGVEAALGRPIPDADLIGHVALGLLEAVALEHFLAPRDTDLDRLFAHLRSVMLREIRSALRRAERAETEPGRERDR